MASLVYNAYKDRVLEGGVNLLTDTIKGALLTSAYTPDQDAHAFFNDVSAGQAVGTGYTAGGQTLTGKTVTQDNTNNRGVFDAADLSWPTSTLTARYVAIYKDTGTAATSPLICLIDLGANQTSTASTFYVQFSADGVMYLG
jgi:hypothetical protein